MSELKRVSEPLCCVDSNCLKLKSVPVLWGECQCCDWLKLLGAGSALHAVLPWRHRWGIKHHWAAVSREQQGPSFGLLFSKSFPTYSSFNCHNNLRFLRSCPILHVKQYCTYKLRNTGKPNEGRYAFVTESTPEVVRVMEKKRKSHPYQNIRRATCGTKQDWAPISPWIVRTQ